LDTLPFLGDLLDKAVVGLLIGTVATWFFAWYYFKRAGDELRREARVLQQQSNSLLQEAKILQDTSNAIVYFLEHPGSHVKATRDPKGRVVGVTVTTTGEAHGTGSVTGVSE
jgi:hypothetical protein